MLGQETADRPLAPFTLVTVQTAPFDAFGDGVATGDGVGVTTIGVGDGLGVATALMVGVGLAWIAAPA